MERLKRYLLATGGLLLCSMTLAVVFSSPTVVRAVADKITDVFVTNDASHPVPVAVTKGRPASEFVTLMHLAASNAGYIQQFPNGQFAEADVIVPDGRVLVVTDANVVFRRNPLEAGQTVTYLLTSQNPSAPGTPIRLRLLTTLNAEGNGSDGQHLQTGAVIASGSRFDDNLPASFDVATLRGYLADDN